MKLEVLESFVITGAKYAKYAKYADISDFISAFHAMEVKMSGLVAG